MLDFVHRPQSPRLLVEPALLASDPPAIAFLRVRIARSQAFTELIGPRYANAVLNVAIDRIKSALHGDDSLLRMDKDDLAILLNPMTSIREAEQVANEIITLLQRPYFCRGKSARLNVSIGIALSPHEKIDDRTDAETLLCRAEAALEYAQVSRSATAVVYCDELEARTTSRLALAVDLTRALELSQMRLYYQPQFSVDRSRLLGFQVSPQWRHPQYGWISPCDFIPLAEELGVLHHISTWVLRTACIQAMTLQPQPVVAIATCLLQFTSGTMLASVEAALSTTGLSPEKLAIELPVQVLLNESTLVQSTIAALHNLGVKLVLANLGSSFSSLDLLSRIPFSSITLDPALVGQSSPQRRIVRTAAMLGNELGITIMAQGIETEQDLLEAEMDGCTSVQGPFLGKVVSASQIAEVVASLAA